jgi:hypothetical protein
MSNFTASETRDAHELYSSARTAGRALSDAEQDHLELVFRAEYIRKIQTEDASRAFAGPRRAVRDDAPSLEDIERRFNINQPDPTEARDSAEAERLLALPAVLSDRDGYILELARLAGAEPADDILLRTDPAAWIESAEREAGAAKLAELMEAANAPEPPNEPDAFIREEMARLKH